MSNATDTPRKQGQRRRRRRGGNNRNKQNQDNQNSSKNPQGGNKGEGRPKRRRSSRKPVKLSFWEKLLVTIGLKEDPNRRKKGSKKQTAPKSNTRNARSSESGERRKPDTTSKRAKRDGRRKGGDPSTVKSGRVYVGNLSFDVTEEDLKELFKGVGTVRNVEIVYNRSTHRSKGYGFVEMMNKDDAIRSVEVLHDQPFMGRNMTVSGAKDKDESTDPDETEPAMEIKASDVELAPLPEKQESAASAEPSAQGEGSEQAESDSAESGRAQAPADPVEQSEQEKPKQD